MLFHKHGGTITKVHSIGHETYKGVADWFFICDVEWRDGTKSQRIQVAPWAVCCDNAVDEQMAEWLKLSKQLNDYLESAGEWHDDKHKRDGRVYRWTPKEKTGTLQLNG